MSMWSPTELLRRQTQEAEARALQVGDVVPDHIGDDILSDLLQRDRLDWKQDDDGNLVVTKVR